MDAKDKIFERPRGIKEWEQVESIAYEERVFKADGREIKMAAHLEVKRPVFHDENRGRPVLELTLQKDKWSFRFRIPREGDNEAEKALEVLQAVLTKKEDGFAAFDRIFKKHEEDRAADRDRRIADHDKRTEQFKTGSGDAKAGRGLGQWSKPGKTKRNRDKRKESRDSR